MPVGMSGWPASSVLLMNIQSIALFCPIGSSVQNVCVCMTDRANFPANKYSCILHELC